MRRLLLALLVALAPTAAPTGAAAAARVALVIGNGAYETAPALRNPANDAAALSARLRSLGFDVLEGVDIDGAEMRRIVRDFGARSEGAALALFFYAGHGLQVAGKNYLLPVDADVGGVGDLDFVAIEADLVIRQMERGAATKIVLLDACRNNPFEREIARSLGPTRAAALERGLARLNAGGGTLIAFATDPGDVALDGDGANSPFTAALLRHIETPGLEINVMMTRVRADVNRETGARQRPWTSSSLIGEVYLAPEAPPSAAAADDTALEIALWQAADAGGTAADYAAYLAQRPDGVFAALAAARLRALAADQAATPGLIDPDTLKLRPDSAIESAAADSAPASPRAAESGGAAVAALFPPASVSPAAPAGDAPGPEAAEAALGLDRAARRDVQERLAALGHDPRGIDGVFGAGTRAAIRAWRSASGREESGFLDAAALAALRAESAGRIDAWRAERRAAAARAAPALFRAVATCGDARGEGRDADRQQAMLKAARACAGAGGAPACCASGTDVTGG